MIILLGKNGVAQFQPVEQSSNLKFTIKNLGFAVDGTFSGFEGRIDFNPKEAGNSNFDVSLSAATVNTENHFRDDHLKGDTYFNISKFPRIHLVSTKITQIKDGRYAFEGILTIKNTSKTISFPFTATPIEDGFIFNASFKMNRKDFGLGGTSTISDELMVMVNVTAKKI
jgi:polyisoprenoid-binding protein YceI